MVKQTTLASEATVKGIGLHSGKDIVMRILPAPEDFGIRFRRTDMTPAVEIPALATRVNDTRLATAVFEGNVFVSTIEHLMSALSGLSVDNALIEVNAPETPILDGSALGYTNLIERAGVVEQNAPRRFCRIKKTVCVTEGDKWAKLEPFEGFAAEFTIAFNNPAIDKTVQTVSFLSGRDDYVQSVAYARTFCFAEDVKKMHAVGLALGGSLENAVVVEGDAILNPEGLRAPDEFAKHKLLDSLGDLYVLGHSLYAKYSAYKSGHGLNNRLLRTVLAEKDAWEIVS